jgi:tetratricopeptide (TPR) repeat protein
MADQKDDDEDIAEELAFERLSAAGADPDVASSFLRAKTDVLRKQLHQLHLSHFREWLYTSAEIVLGLVILLIFVGIASAVWSAAHDNGLVIESFSVPTDMTNRGLTGEVVAARLLDKLSGLQAKTVSSRAASSYANDWGKDIKVQIPETGVSIGQLDSYLRGWLGNETHISGELYRDVAGNLILTARVGSDAGPVFAGKEGDLDKLLQKAAESVYQRTQPYRYAVYLSSLNLNDQSKADAVYRRLAANSSVQERAWAYIGLSNIYKTRNQYDESLRVLHKALALRPNFAMALLNLSQEEASLQHDQESYEWSLKLVKALKSGDASDMDPRAAAINARVAQAGNAGSVGDFQEQLRIDAEGESLPDAGNQLETLRETDVIAYAFLHDSAGVHGAMSDNPLSADKNVILNRTAIMLGAYYELGRWSDVLAVADTLEVMAADLGQAGISFEERFIRPFAAIAMAMKGDIHGANTRIEHTALDCDLCVRARGRIAQIQHRWNAAAYWFAMVSTRSPSIPFADTDWGMMLLEKGDATGAIEKFRSANRKGPHFADPLEGWGEALMMQNRSDLALAKFEQAGKYAPNWGRLHLKWGEALQYIGDKGGAKAQFAAAAGLDLTALERAALSKDERASR